MSFEAPSNRYPRVFTQEILSLTSLTAPPPPDPEGFDTETKAAPNMPLNPVGVYVNAIHMLHDFAQHPWSQVVEAPATIRREPAYNLQIRALVTTNLRRQSRVRFSFLVLALYRSVRLMAGNWPGFVTMETAILYNGKEVGRIKFTPARFSTFGMHPLVNDSTIEDRYSDVSTTNLTELHGIIYDREIGGFVIRWQEIAPNVPVQDIMFATLDGMTTVAQFDSRSICRNAVRGMSAGVIRGVECMLEPTLTAQGVELPCWAMARAYLLVSMKVVVARRVYRQLEIEIWYHGVQLGRGHIKRTAEMIGEDDGGQADTS